MEVASRPTFEGLLGRRNTPPPRDRGSTGKPRLFRLTSCRLAPFTGEARYVSRAQQELDRFRAGFVADPRGGEIWFAIASESAGPPTSLTGIRRWLVTRHGLEP